MANPLFNAMNKNAAPKNFFDTFPDFMQQMKGKNPNEILNNLITSGKVSQQQLDAAQRQAQQMSGMFDKFRGMFNNGR